MVTEALKNPKTKRPEELAVDQEKTAKLAVEQKEREIQATITKSKVLIERVDVVLPK